MLKCWQLYLVWQLLRVLQLQKPQPRPRPSVVTEVLANGAHGLNTPRDKKGNTTTTQYTGGTVSDNAGPLLHSHQCTFSSGSHSLKSHHLGQSSRNKWTDKTSLTGQSILIYEHLNCDITTEMYSELLKKMLVSFPKEKIYKAWMEHGFLSFGLWE